MNVRAPPAVTLFDRPERPRPPSKTPANRASASCTRRRPTAARDRDQPRGSGANAGDRPARRGAPPRRRRRGVGGRGRARRPVMSLARYSCSAKTIPRWRPVGIGRPPDRLAHSPPQKAPGSADLLVHPSPCGTSCEHDRHTDSHLLLRLARRGFGPIEAAAERGRGPRAGRFVLGRPADHSRCIAWATISPPLFARCGVRTLEHRGRKPRWPLGGGCRARPLFRLRGRGPAALSPEKKKGSPTWEESVDSADELDRGL